MLIIQKISLNEIGYDFQKFVSYEKGCYRGQEIIARLKYLGKITKKAVVFSGSINSYSMMDWKRDWEKNFSN